jgi:hypothetical protein
VLKVSVTAANSVHPSAATSAVSTASRRVAMRAGLLVIDLAARWVLALGAIQVVRLGLLLAAVW